MGSLQIPGKVPLPERFFGGNNEEFLIAGDTWQIRPEPGYSRDSRKQILSHAGRRGQQEFSYVSPPLTDTGVKPSSPKTSPTILSSMRNSRRALTIVTSTLQNYYASKDLHFERRGPTTERANSSPGVEDCGCCGPAARPDQADLFKPCSRAVSGTLRRVGSAITPQAADQYGLVMFLGSRIRTSFNSCALRNVRRTERIDRRSGSRNFDLANRDAQDRNGRGVQPDR